MNQTRPIFNRKDLMFLSFVIVVVLAITSLPWLYANSTAPDDRQFMGVLYNIPDHFQYFSWMRESQTNILVANQLTPEPSTPLLFNFLWLSLGRVQAATGLDYQALYQITRLLAGVFVMAATYYFCAVVFTQRTKRVASFLIGVLGSGLGWIWVVEKQIANRPDILYPFDIYTAEPNTFFTILAFPHFAIATGLIALIFALVLIAQREQSLRVAFVAALVSLLLGVQHAYDMFTIYGVIGLYGLFLWIRDRKFPMFTFKMGVIIALISVWPALQAFYITTADPVWQGVLSQFGNAGAVTPRPLHLPILMGIAWLLAIWALDIRTPWRDRDDTHLFIMAWFLAHFILIYLPLNFQIHLLSGWQVIIGVLATIGISTRVLPILQRWFQGVPRNQLAMLFSGALLMLVLPSNMYLIPWRLLDMRNAYQNIDERVPDNRYYTRTSEFEAMKFVETQVQSDDVVLASLPIGQFIPAITGARTFIGHWAQTLDFYGKESLVKAFFNAETADEERLNILNTFSVDYVIYGPEEIKLNPDTPFDPAGAAYLEEVYSNDEVKVFRVITETDGS